MKKVSILLILSLVLLPVIWNGIGLLHYMVDHTHTFCLDDSDHTHQPVEECLSICQITPNQSQHIPTLNDYQELKQYLTFNKNLLPITILPVNQFNFKDPHLLESSFSTDIFHPPIV